MRFLLGHNLVFMSTSLEKLVANLPDESLKYTSEILKITYLN